MSVRKGEREEGARETGGGRMKGRGSVRKGDGVERAVGANEWEGSEECGTIILQGW